MVLSWLPSVRAGLMLDPTWGVELRNTACICYVLSCTVFSVTPTLLLILTHKTHKIVSELTIPAHHQEYNWQQLNMLLQ